MCSSLSHRKRLISSRRKIYNAFCRLHDAGISHNDVEPRNILLTPSGEVKVVDFHVASEHKCPADGCDYYERISRYLNF
ncbi:uncharacterized protein EV420DRAFT_1536803 [Desarmillaria tabescens]|uniref:Protein kinase domain-containing protein n=1 Tax=Armillaria tabescens TaxID=1929756 RepID=A0AA39KEC6_ARMTA|nr:uncharacterized protein EV420DRAFT_1536803 [Desarmillaria tabescens]KAK0459606.1 hypothetical protein EV420DRAFT_1536803 [Desarmillaria tabescens]